MPKKAKRSVAFFTL